MLTQEQIDQYKELGYLGIEGVLSDREVKELQRTCNEFLEKSREATEHTDVFDLEPDHTPDNPGLRRIKLPHKQHPVFDALLRNEKILDLVEQLIGPGVRFQSTKLNMKRGDAGSPVEWHQDWAFYPHTNDDLLAVGVAIDDMTLENGCLRVLPESHKGRVYSHHQDGVFVGGVTEPDFEFEDSAPITLKAGGISIHHTRALHGSAPNTSGKPRRLFLIEYNAVDAWPLNGVSDWDDFNSRILRGEPTFEPRLEPVPVRIAMPKPEKVGSIFEIQTQMARPQYGRVAT